MVNTSVLRMLFDGFKFQHVNKYIYFQIVCFIAVTE